MSKVYGIGLMSGTSLDGIDAVLVEKNEDETKFPFRIIESLTESYDEEIYESIMRICDPEMAMIEEVSAMNMYLGRKFGAVVHKLLEKANKKADDIHFISSHGQTIFHQPIEGKKRYELKNTLQIGDLSVLSEETGIAVVGDFRTADMAVGGQGAPLVSYLDYLLFSRDGKARAVQNIGGIGNVTYIPSDGDISQVKSFDTGPGNMVIDAVVHSLTNGKLTFDCEGKIAKQGKVNEEVLTHLMDHEYFQIPLPKTTGRELFGRSFTTRLMNEFSHVSDEDLITTVSEWTVVSIVKGYQDFIEVDGIKLDEVIIGGGGSFNLYLLDRLQQKMPHTKVRTIDDFGISSSFKEALAFAVMGYQTIQGKENQIPAATGAERPVIMGKIAYSQPAAYERVMSIRSGIR
ncbi:anhydro-N-acetylmuramic acid kinase [Halobacillus sp. Marseille-Q1614]|uniref:anhydro-N-acetylmuramic acid kinase n=1 Tax=Halobacillus sp. Marseille-Q1614 TaxID=2709134 RepID=UPI00156E8A35|nr:anhydro-N-acetylmuramic acid kinase [Halobacillus sp. Marseille-Q1614]